MPVWGNGHSGWGSAPTPGYGGVYNGGAYNGGGGYGQPAPYGQPQGGWAPQQAPQNGLGLAGMICGIVGAVLGFIFIGIIPAGLAIIFGALGLGRVRRGVATNRGQALTGIITGIVGVLGFALVLTLVIVFGHESCADRYNTNSRAYQVCVDNNNGN